MSIIYLRNNRPAAIIFFALLLVLVIFTMLSVAATGSAYGACNTYFGNLCNSLKFCCVNVGVPGCNNPLSCAGVLATDLTPNIEFLGLFWMNFVLFLMQLTFVITMSVIYIKEEKEGEEGEEAAFEPPLPPLEEKEAILIPPPQVTMSTAVATEFRTHGLKKRVK